MDSTSRAAETILLWDGEKLKIEAWVESDTTTFRLQGALDEDTNFSVVLEFLKSLQHIPEQIRFELGKVRAMNSCGVREWLLFMERLGPTTRLSFASLSEALVEQANIISGLLGRGHTTIESFQAPFHCPQCSKGYWMLLKPAQVGFGPAGPELPAVSCPRCGTKLQFDSLEQEYFEFLRLRTSA